MPVVDQLGTGVGSSSSVKENSLSATQETDRAIHKSIFKLANRKKILKQSSLPSESLSYDNDTSFDDDSSLLITDKKEKRKRLRKGSSLNSESSYTSFSYSQSISDKEKVSQTIRGNSVESYYSNASTIPVDQKLEIRFDDIDEADNLNKTQAGDTLSVGLLQDKKNKRTLLPRCSESNSQCQSGVGSHSKPINDRDLNCEFSRSYFRNTPRPEIYFKHFSSNFLNKSSIKRSFSEGHKLNHIPHFSFATQFSSRPNTDQQRLGNLRTLGLFENRINVAHGPLQIRCPRQIEVHNGRLNREERLLRSNRNYCAKVTSSVVQSEERSVDEVLSSACWWGARLIFYSLYFCVLIAVIVYTEISKMAVVPITVFLIVISLAFFFFILCCVCFVVYI